MAEMEPQPKTPHPALPPLPKLLAHLVSTNATPPSHPPHPNTGGEGTSLRVSYLRDRPSSSQPPPPRGLLEGQVGHAARRWEVAHLTVQRHTALPQRV